MHRSKGIESPILSDDDSISLTSTVPSEPKEEYPIEGILAERILDGTTRYLVKWEGYPDERCTWEPGTSFQDDQTFHDWQNKKMRISRGLDSAYDVGGLEMRVESWIEATEKRKARRRAKRFRLGLPVHPESEGENSNGNAAEAPEEASSDPDEPMKKRRGSLKSDLRPKSSRRWTPMEEVALKTGLELVKGPYWDKILDLFGPTGTKSQDLINRDALDLEAKTLELRIDYLKSGREVPQYLQLADIEEKGKAPRKPKDASRQLGDGDSSSTADSLIEELQRVSVKIKPKQKLVQKQKEARTAIKQNKFPNQRPRDSISGQKYQEENQSPASIPKPMVSVAQMIPRIEPGKKPVSNRRESQMGSAGRGPLRLGLGDRKLNSAGQRRQVSGAAILENWNASVKPRRKPLPLQNAANSIDKPLERFGKLSTKRRYEKASRNERAPDIESLTLRNPKDFSVVKRPSISSPAIQTPTKTPFELYQESFGKEKETPAVIETSASTSIIDAVEGPLDIADTNERSFESTKQISQKSRPVVFPNRVPTSDSIPEFSTSFTPSIPVPHSYVAYNAFDREQVIGTVKLGQDWVDVGAVRFRGLNGFSKRMLLGLKSGPRDLFIWLKYNITAEDYKAHFHDGSGEGGSGFSGYIAPFPNVEERIIMIVETLKMHASGALLLSNEFSMLVYPSGSEDWSFLDNKLPSCPPAARLRFVIGRPYPELMREGPPKSLSEPTEEEVGFVEEEEPLNLENVRSTVTLRESECNINAVFRNVYNVDYSRLVASTTPMKTTETPSFFLIFPPSKVDERDLLIQFLQHNKAGDIFTSETKGAWSYFSTHVNAGLIDAGVIIIHEDFFDLWRIPDLAHVLRKPINVWNFNLTPSLLAPDPHLNRLFPHGAAILLTDGLFLHRPHEAARILTWFRLIIHYQKAPRTWKLCTRPRLKDWLLTLQDDRNMDDGKVYVQCYTEVWRMLKEEGMMEECEPGEEQPTEDALMCFMGEASAFDESVGKGVTTNADVDKEAIARNDQVLIEWFAGYAMTKVEDFRRFDIVTGHWPADEQQKELKERYKVQWSHVEVVPAEELYKKHKVATWEVLEKEEEKRVKRMKEKWAEEDAAAARAEAQKRDRRRGRSRSNSDIVSGEK